MQGKTIVITGATSGIGEAAAEALAGKGARIVFVARNADKARALLARLKTINPGADHDWVRADLSTIAAMKAAGLALAEKAPKIDVLVNNAGAMFDRREVTADGLEMTFAVNHMAYFVVTEVLRPNIVAGGRIVSTASGAHAFAALDFDDLQSAKGYAGFRTYGRSKLCNVLWTRALARRLEGSGVTANCFHPGGVSTGFGSNLKGPLALILGLAKPFMLGPAQGADTLVYLASSDAVAGKTGGYWAKRKLTAPSADGRNDANAERLWALSANIAGMPA
jgi:NAD(P)-dependent dehydrogenase (short-subunit alcohol dehydrogenase family)